MFLTIMTQWEDLKKNFFFSRNSKPDSMPSPFASFGTLMTTSENSDYSNITQIIFIGLLSFCLPEIINFPP